MQVLEGVQVGMTAGGVAAEQGALCSVALAVAGHLPVGLCSAPRPLLSAPVPDLLIPHPCRARGISQGLTASSQSSGSSTGLAARSLCLFPAMRASSPLRFTKSSRGWFPEALPSLEEEQEGAGGEGPAWEGPLFSQRPAQTAAVGAWNISQDFPQN